MVHNIHDKHRHGYNDMVVCVDGKCVMCDGMTQMIAKYSPHAKFMWVQHPSTSELLKELGVTDFDPSKESMIVIENGVVYRRSDGMIRVFSSFTSIFFRIVAFIMSFIPLFVRNTILRVVASRRYTIGGKKDTCTLPDRKLRSRFLHEM
jgi:predicted DCC family thiol-disulfide oxidoreductase YuxK